MTPPTYAGAARRVLLILAGPAAVGLCMKLQPDPGGGGVSISWPLAAIAVLVTLPALYIAAAALRSAPPIAELVASGVGALESGSIVLLGVVPALAFLLATAGFGWHAWLGAAAFGLGAMVVLRTVFAQSFLRFGPRGQIVFIVWAMVACGLAVHLAIQGRAA